MEPNPEQMPPQESPSGSVAPAALLGIAVAILMLFVEIQLLNATNPVRPAEARQAVVANHAFPPDIEEVQPPLRVQARRLAPNAGPSLVSQHD